MFVVNGDQAREVPVETRLEGRDWVEVTGALSPGDRVVVTGQTQLANGARVVVRQPPPPSQSRGEMAKTATKPKAAAK